MADSSPTPSTIARLVDAGALPPWRRHVRTVFGGGIALAVGGAVLVAGMWLSVVALVRAERAEAIDSEMGKNANLALALEVQTNQRIRSIDQFLLLMRHQYEQAPPRVPFRELMAPAIADAKGIALIAAIDERGDVVETLTDIAATNASAGPMFRFHQQNETRDLAVGPPVRGQVSGKSVITLTRRVNKPDGAFGGIVTISVEPSYLTVLFEKTELGPDDVVSQVLENGITLARRRGATSSFGENIASSQLMREYGRQPIGNFVGPGGVDGHVRVFSYRRLADYPGDRDRRDIAGDCPGAAVTARARLLPGDHARQPGHRRRVCRRRRAAGPPAARQPPPARAGLAPRRSAGRHRRQRPRPPHHVLEPQR